jgi:hypothetical protein
MARRRICGIVIQKTPTRAEIAAKSATASGR